MPAAGRAVARTVAAVLVALAVAAGCAPVPPAPIVPPSPVPGALPAGPLPTGRVAAYVDVTTPPLPALADYAAETGQQDLVLAFVLAAPHGCDPAWGGTAPLRSEPVASWVADLRRRGSQLTVASGGAHGPYLENACETSAELADAYATALDTVGSDHLDVDVEADVDADRVADALALLQRDRQVAITLTLMVQDQGTGLTPEALELVRAVTTRGTAVRVNAMAMNFPPNGSWRDAVIEASDAVSRQWAEIYPAASPADRNARLGITLMIGRNDMGMVTTPEDAEAVTKALLDRGFGQIGFWSVARDNGGCPAAAAALNSCSGVEQYPFRFTDVLGRFAP